MNILPINQNITNEKDITSVQKKMENLKKGSDDEKLMETCREFESVFLYMMFKEMRKTVPDSDGVIEKSQGTKIFEEMYLEEMSKELSKTDDGIGIAKMLYNQFKQGYTNW